MRESSPTETHWNALQQELAQHPVQNLRLEVVVSELLRQGLFRLDELVLVPDLSSHYSLDADVSLQGYVENKLVINTPQFSFYDRLPEHLFHQPVRHTSEDDYQLIRRDEEKQEQEARVFFRPFDNRLFQFRIAIEQWEGTALAGDNRPLLRQLVALLWSPTVPIEVLTGQQLVHLLQLLASVHRVAGNLPICQSFLSQIIGQRVQLSLSCQPLKNSLSLEEYASVGSSQLGLNSALTGDLAETHFPVIDVLVGPVPVAHLEGFLPGGPYHQLMEELCELIFPLEADYIVQSFTDSDDSGWLGHPDSAIGRLGYTTFIQSNTL